MGNSLICVFTMLESRNDGYETAEIADLVARKTELLRGYRIDEVIPGEVLLPTLFAVACSGDRVLDFGGGFGFHYLTASQAFFSARSFRWAVVEHPHTLARSEPFETEQLRFFESAEAAAQWLGSVDLLHSNGTLQYLSEPEAMMRRLLHLNPSRILWARMLLGDERSEGPQTAALSAHGPGPAPAGLIDREIIHRTVRMERSSFMQAHGGLRLVWQSADTFLFAR